MTTHHHMRYTRGKKACAAITHRQRIACPETQSPSPSSSPFEHPYLLVLGQKAIILSPSFCVSLPRLRNRQRKTQDRPGLDNIGARRLLPLPRVDRARSAWVEVDRSLSPSRWRGPDARGITGHGARPCLPMGMSMKRSIRYGMS